MNPVRWQAMLDEVTAVHGVRGAMVISADDGLVVYHAAMEGLETADVAALASALVRRCESLVTALGEPSVRLCTLAAERGSVLAARGEGGLWMVAVTEPDAELGRLRLLLGDHATELA
jgi:predicted regulator of Ras-like GTPase activity (Roadblock/LC7/MglB family)